MTTIETPCLWHFSRFPRSQSNPATAGIMRLVCIFVHANVNRSPVPISSDDPDRLQAPSMPPSLLRDGSAPHYSPWLMRKGAPEAPFRHRHLLGIECLSPDDINQVLDV